MAKSQIICVVDDEPAIRETLENVLSDEGYPVMSCRDSEDFYAKLEKQTPALVLLDIWLPGTDGMAILSQLRETHPDIPVIMMSGHAGIDAAVNAIKLGAVDFMEKPLRLEILLDKISIVLSNKPPKKFKDHVEKLIKDNNDLIVIIKRYENKKIDFIELGLKDIEKHKNQILSEFKKLTENRQKMISNIYENYTFEQKNLENLTKEMDGTTVQEYKKSNCYIFINETAQQIQKFRDNPTEDHIMINNFIGFSNLKHDNQKISDHSMITEINGYRTKKVLENYKANFFSPYMGNDVIEINSIISKYLASATFDAKNTKLIDLLFNRIHTIKAHSLTDDILKTSFRELESYFQDKNETLIGIIDYEFNKQQNRRINNISINPDQIKEITLDKGDRLITIANFNNLEMVNNSQWLHIL